MQSIRIIEIPACRMVSSGSGMFGQDLFERFHAWFSAQPRTLYPRDFLFWDGTGFCWLYVYDDGLTVPAEFDIVDFAGGLYAVATDIDGQTDTDAMKQAVDAFLDESGFVRDTARFELGHVITPPSAAAALGYHQMDYFTPIKEKPRGIL